VGCATTWTWKCIPIYGIRIIPMYDQCCDWFRRPFVLGDDATPFVINWNDVRVILTCDERYR
jgi:hypothetical protein